MELRHLRYFVAVAETENVSRAALRLHVSQPAVSRQIRDLEEELDFKLFERTAKSIELTPAGKTFLKETRAVLERVDEAVKKARTAAKGSGEVHVGYAPSLTARFLPQALRACQAALPNLRVKLHDLSSEEMAAGLRAGTLDVAITAYVPGGILRDFHFAELTRDDLCIAVAPSHRLASRKAVTRSDLVREPLITYTRKDYPEAHKLLMSLFAGEKTKPHITEEHDSVSSLIAAVEAGTGIAVVARSLECTAGQRLTFLPLSPAAKPVIIGAVWVKNKVTPAAEQFLKCARELVLPQNKPV
jgi:LysR family transcriptional regulator, benzoate and cis,cis-muconate-responsive activator of ben and cat genes